MAISAVGLTGLSPPGFAQSYPNGLIRFINASSAGGASDLFVRALSEELRTRLKQPVIVENRPGGSFNIAAKACADADPDGYTFCVIPNEVFVYNPVLFKNLPFDPETSVEQIMALFFLPQVLAVRTDLNVDSIDKLVSLSKREPGTLSYSSPSVAHTAFMESFVKREKGGDLVKLPIRGGGEAINGLMTGTTPVTFIGVSNLLPYLEAKTVIGLVVDSSERIAMLPDIPTVREVGFKGDMIQPFFGLFAPAKTPKDIVEQMRKEILSIMTDSEFRRKYILERGLTPTKGTPEEIKNLIATGRAVAERIIAEAGLTPQ